MPGRDLGFDVALSRANEVIVNRFVNRIWEAFKDWLGKHIPDCKEMTPTIGESLDRKLSSWERLMMKLHLFTCDRCGRYLQHLGFMKATMKAHGEAIADPETDRVEMSGNSKARIKQMLTRAALS